MFENLSCSDSFTKRPTKLLEINSEIEMKSDLKVFLNIDNIVQVL